MIHFEFISMFGVIEGFKFILLCVNIYLPQHHLLKILSFHLKSIDAKCKDSFLPFNSVPLIYTSILISEPYCLYYCSFVVIFEIRSFSVLTWITRPFPSWSPASTFAFCRTFSVQHPERSYSNPDLTYHLCV